MRPALSLRIPKNQSIPRRMACGMMEISPHHKKTIGDEVITNFEWVGLIDDERSSY